MPAPAPFMDYVNDPVGQSFLAAMAQKLAANAASIAQFAQTASKMAASPAPSLALSSVDHSPAASPPQTPSYNTFGGIFPQYVTPGSTPPGQAQPAAPALPVVAPIVPPAILASVIPRWEIEKDVELCLAEDMTENLKTIGTTLECRLCSDKGEIIHATFKDVIQAAKKRNPFPYEENLKAAADANPPAEDQEAPTEQAQADSTDAQPVTDALQSESAAQASSSQVKCEPSTSGYKPEPSSGSPSTSSDCVSEKKAKKPRLDSTNNSDESDDDDDKRLQIDLSQSNVESDVSGINCTADSSMMDQSVDLNETAANDADEEEKSYCKITFLMRRVKALLRQKPTFRIDPEQLKYHKNMARSFPNMQNRTEDEIMRRKKNTVAARVSRTKNKLYEDILKSQACRGFIENIEKKREVGKLYAYANALVELNNEEEKVDFHMLWEQNMKEMVLTKRL